jgi:hypothetical protein
MPKAELRENARIQAFLRGPEKSMSTQGVQVFSGLPVARKFATNTPQINASFTMEPGGRWRAAFVTITKTQTWFDKQQGDLAQYKAELNALTDRFGEIAH